MARNPDLIDHIGIDLWRATENWNAQFRKGMVEQGFVWFGEARGNLIRHIPRKGIAQNTLATKAGITKQAIQQHLDDLERDGVIKRIPDPNDARRKLVTFTDEGFQALTIANQIKQQIEAEYSEILGKETMQTLSKALQRLAEHPFQMG